MTMEYAGVVDAHFLHLAGELMHSFLDESFCYCRYVFNGAVEPHGGVDAMREQIAGHSRSGGVDVDAPQGVAALWKVLVDRPVLKKVGAVVKDLAKLAR